MKAMHRFAAAVSAVLVLLAAPALAQHQGTIVLNPDVIPVEYKGATVPLRDWTPDPNVENPREKPEKPGYHPKGDWILNEYDHTIALPVGEDPVWQKDNPAQSASQANIDVNIDGMGYTGVNPADPSLDAGPNHVIQMINGSSGAYFIIYDKFGTVLQAQTYYDNYFGLGAGLGDPIVMYDAIGDRWVMTEFSASGNNMHVAVSTTPDPLGSWHTFVFNAPSFPDYPKYSIWDNMYLITTNEAQTANYALNRTDLLNGVATTAQRFTVPDFGTIGFQAATPVSLNGTTPPAAGTPGLIMRMRDDAWVGASNDALEIWEFDVDFNNSANTSLTLQHELPISPFDSELCGYTSFSCIPQPGTGTQLDPLREVLMNRIAYRNFGTHESIVCCHVTDVDGTDRAGVRWYELRRTGGQGSAWTIYQEGTYSPDTDSRFMCSIAIDAFGSIAIAYNVSSSSTFPSLRYTGRNSSDPLGTMTVHETTIVAGSGSNASNRYGDYNQLNTDPDGQTFWFTGMYNAAAQWSTRVTSFTVSAPGVGCMDNTACNYDPDATTDSGLCSYPGDVCNDDDPLTANDVLQADCSCAGEVILGCTDPFADNYDPTATVDDDSCVFSCQVVTLTLLTDCWGSEVSWTLTDATGATVDSGSGYGNVQTYTETFCLGDGCYDFNIFDSFGDGMAGSEYTACGVDGDYALTDPDGNVLVQMTVANYGSGESQNFCITVGDIEGCTDPTACNFNAAATLDDGSCEFTSCAGCTDATACNYDATATIENGTCEFTSCAGCTDATACNYDVTATIDDNSCESTSCAGCTDATACNFDATATIDDGSCQLPDGCTDMAACNYSPTALCDDSSCEYFSCAPCFGDIDGDDLITVADLLMVLGDFGCTGVCTADLTEDGVVDTSDILALLGVFGTTCP
ncbi:MAG: hypothetical protein ACON34_07295 [Flavobacteriales bacterium]